MNNAYTNYYKELCPNEESWVHTQLSNEREKFEDEISKLQAEIAEWQKVNLELHHAIKPIDGETLLGAARTLRNEIDALNESILVQQIFSDDRIRANEAEAEVERLKNQRDNLLKPMLDQAIVRAEKVEAELATERVRLDWLDQRGYLVDKITHGASTPHPEDYWICTDGYSSGSAKTVRDAIDAAMNKNGE